MLINIAITKTDSGYQVDLSQKLSSLDLYMEDRHLVMQTTPILRTLVERFSGKELLISSIRNTYDSESGILGLWMTLNETES